MNHFLHTTLKYICTCVTKIYHSSSLCMHNVHFVKWLKTPGNSLTFNVLFCDITLSRSHSRNEIQFSISTCVNDTREKLKCMQFNTVLQKIIFAFELYFGYFCHLFQISGPWSGLLQWVVLVTNCEVKGKV